MKIDEKVLDLSHRLRFHFISDSLNDYNYEYAEYYVVDVEVGPKKPYGTRKVKFSIGQTEIEVAVETLKDILKISGEL